MKTPGPASSLASSLAFPLASFVGLFIGFSVGFSANFLAVISRAYRARHAPWKRQRPKSSGAFRALPEGRGPMPEEFGESSSRPLPAALRHRAAAGAQRRGAAGRGSRRHGAQRPREPPSGRQLPTSPLAPRAPQPAGQRARLQPQPRPQVQQRCPPGPSAMRPSSAAAAC